jgi:hypothetical protein
MLSICAELVSNAAGEPEGIAGKGEFCETSRQYHIIAGKSYQPGDQVFLCYGHYTNVELLALYGFLLEENPHDAVHLPDTVWPDAVQLEKEQMMLHGGMNIVALISTYEGREHASKRKKLEATSSCQRVYVLAVSCVHEDVAALWHSLVLHMPFMCCTGPVYCCKPVLVPVQSFEIHACDIDLCMHFIPVFAPLLW